MLENDIIIIITQNMTVFNSTKITFHCNFDINIGTVGYIYIQCCYVELTDI